MPKQETQRKRGKAPRHNKRTGKFPPKQRHHRKEINRIGDGRVSWAPGKGR